jgi:hypothetical protein
MAKMTYGPEDACTLCSVFDIKWAVAKRLAVGSPAGASLRKS